LPILPLQILYPNIVSDVFPALALGLSGPGSAVGRSSWPWAWSRWRSARQSRPSATDNPIRGLR